MVILKNKQKSLKRLQSIHKLCEIVLFLILINTSLFEAAESQILSSTKINTLILPSAGNIINTQQKAAAIDPTKTQILNTSSSLTSLQKQIYQYKGEIIIHVNDNQSQNITFQTNFIQDDEPCNYKKCFLGWVSEYSVNNQETIQGYPKVSGQQPIFQFDTNDNDDNKVAYSNDLDQIWKQLIEISCQKFNPLFQSKNTKYIFSQIPSSNPSSSAGLRSAFFVAQPSIKMATFEDNNFKINNLESKNSKLSQIIQINTQDNLISQRSQNLEINLNSEADSNQQGPSPDLNGKISVNFDLTKRSTDSSNIFESLKNQLSQKTIPFMTLSKANLEKIRASPQIIQKLKIDSDFKVQDIQPKISLIQDTLLPGQTIDNFDIASQIKKAQIQGLNYKSDDNRQLPEFDAIDSNLIKQLQLTQNNFIESQQAINAVNTKIQSVDLAQNGRNLQTNTVNILSYTKSLYKKTVLGKTIQLQIQVVCDLLIYPYALEAKCVGNLIYNIFGNIKTLKIFQFTKYVFSTWSWSQAYSGTWSFVFQVPLPPPVSFITINFYVGVKYYFTINLFSKKISQIPYKWQLGALVETGIDTDSRASLRVWPLQGGVYIKGTLVKVGTDPSLTFNFLFAKKKIQVLLSWYFWIIAFQFEWGFFYRYWKLFSGWSNIKIISKWTINGVYQKYKILYQYSYISI